MILNDIEEENCYEVTEPNKIIRDRGKAEILSRPYTKKYRFNYDKRVVDASFKTFPFGF
jgi:hypothetical protein